MKTTILFAAAAALTVSAWAAFAQPAVNGDPARGRELYIAKGCAYCHGTVGQGGGGRTGGLRLAQMPFPFAVFLNQLRNPVNEMPPYVEGVLPESEAADIHAFVMSLPRPADASTIPILNN